MRKLLRANFSRLFQNKGFWISMGALAIVGLYACVENYREMVELDLSASPDAFFFMSYFFSGFALAALISMFLGSEYGDGTMRNKLVTGSRRTKVYLSNFITCTAAGLLADAAYAAVACALGIPLLGGFEMPIAQILSWSAVGCLLTVAFSAIFTLASMLIQNKAAVAIVCLLGIFASLLVVSRISSRLQEPEFYDGVEVSEDGVQEAQHVPNAHYLNEKQRAAYQTALDILPTGQGIELASCEVPNPLRMALYSGAIIVLSNGIGLFFFKRKDLK